MLQVEDIVSFTAFNQNCIFFCLCRKHGMDFKANQVVQIHQLSVVSVEKAKSYLKIIITQL